MAALRGLVGPPLVARTPGRSRAPIGLDERAQKPPALYASIEHGSSLKLASGRHQAVGPSLAPVGPSQRAVLARETSGTGRIAWNPPDRPSALRERTGGPNTKPAGETPESPGQRPTGQNTRRTDVLAAAVAAAVAAADLHRFVTRP